MLSKKVKKLVAAAQQIAEDFRDAYAQIEEEREQLDIAEEALRSVDPTRSE